MNPVPTNFIYPTNMKPIVEEIMNGEYQISLDIHQPVIFDIGANIGAFSLWAFWKWPGCTIHAYEPSPYNFSYLVKNLDGFPNIQLHNLAVGNPKHVKLFKGKNNCGQASFFQTGYQQTDFETVKTIAPSKLPKHCDILKIDTEGCELEILEGLKDRRFQTIMLEYHSEEDRQKITELLSGYTLVTSLQTWANYGVLKYLHKPL